MKPGDLIFWEDDGFGLNRFWRVESVILGAVGTEDLVRIRSLTHLPGLDEEGQRQPTMLVPECLVRGLVYEPSELKVEA